MRRFEATGDGWDTADGPPVPVSIDAVSVETSWADRWSDESGERVGRRQEPALARSMSLPIHKDGPKDASLTDRPLSVNAGLTGVDRDGRSPDSAMVVNVAPSVGHGRVTQCPTCPIEVSANGREAGGCERVTQHPTGAAGGVDVATMVKSDAVARAEVVRSWRPMTSSLLASQTAAQFAALERSSEVERRERRRRTEHEVAAEAALLLYLHSCGDLVHEDYRPGPGEIEWARAEMAEAVERMAAPMPDTV